MYKIVREGGEWGFLKNGEGTAGIGYLKNIKPPLTSIRIKVSQ